MPEISSKIRLFDREMDVVEVPVTVRKETPSQYELEDGSIIIFSSVATVVYRLDGQWDPEGNPVYLVKTGQSVTTLRAPENLRRRT